MDFIFMLTRNDRTVEDCLELVDDLASAGLRHIGFKDIGVARPVLVELARRIRAVGATSYLEIVSDSRPAALESARLGVELGIDRLLGGTDVDAVLPLLAGTETCYYPFAGFPVGHPTRLGGRPEDIEAHCRSFSAKGCGGADLLAYRAVDADPVALVRAARRGLGAGYLIVAGSINSAERIARIGAAGADAFTIGSALFDGSYSPTKGALRSQLADVLAACAGTSRPT